MLEKVVNGLIFKDAVISGANNIANQKAKVDELNVFPVPDGDTGTNMSMTATAAAKALDALDNPTVAEAADCTASAMLRGARGNSGVILSLLFRGISKGLKGAEELTPHNLADALSQGVKAAYKAVMKPTEGTVLTVARLAAEHATAVAGRVENVVELFDEIVSAAADALAHTPEQLPVLKQAGVVDAGGKGLLVILEGMRSVIRDGKKIERLEQGAVEQPKLQNAAAEFEGEIAFTYCTEFIVNRGSHDKGALALRAYLESIGDSVVVVEDEDIIKVHVHTDNPGNAIQEGLKFGYLTNMKIDNMRDQHESKAHQARQSKKQEEYAAVDESVEFGFVAVAAGQGIQALFGDLGVDKVVSGGQTMNPSTDDILGAIHSVPAKTVFVLPNNKNIIMAAEQAEKLADRKVCVLQTRTIPQGISAMLAFDPDRSLAQNRVDMTKAIDRVATGQVMFAARDSEYEGHKIKKGEILAIENGRMSFIEKDVTKAAYKLIKSMYKRDSQFVTIIYGADVTDDAAERLQEIVSAKLGDSAEVSLINGGQPVYYYILSVE